MWTAERLMDKDYSAEAKRYRTEYNELVKYYRDREHPSPESEALGVLQLMADARNRLVMKGLREAYPDKQPGRK